MKFYALISAMLLSGSIAFAQNDPVLMTVGGNPVCRSEFEYAYLKNNARPKGGDEKTTVADFLNLYIDYQLKLKAALDAKLDTMAVLGQVLENRDERACQIYQERQVCMKADGGYIKPSHILLRLNQKATFAEQAKKKVTADSLYEVLNQGGDFAALARKYSDDKESAKEGGKLPWITKGQTVKLFEDTAFSLQVGEVSKPVLTEFGYEIIRLDAKQDSLATEEVKAELNRYLDAKNIRARVVAGDSQSEKVKADELAQDEKMQDELRELREGYLIREICQRNVWAKAAEDEKGQAAYFAKNKKKYRWVEPRLDGKRRRKGPKDYKEVQSLVIADYQDKLEKDWVQTLRHKYPVVVNEEVLATVNKH